MNNYIQNKLICGDNLEELAKLPKGSVDLIYIDPPFFTHKQYEVIWGDEAETRSFEDRWEGGIEHYIGWLKPRAQLMWEVLKSTGSFYLHCDWHANAHLRIMMDDIFGEKNFRNEIIWWYSWGGRSKFQWSHKHDTVLFYTKSDIWTFNYLDVLDDHTLAAESAKTRVKYKGALVHHREGTQSEIPKDKVLPSDTWYIATINAMSKERVGYPTQKPEALLEKIVKASSNKDDVVADFFCGCGTAIAVAQRLGRKWIGIDISPTSIKVIKERFEIGMRATGFQVAPIIEGKDYIIIGAPKTINQLKKLKPFEFQNWVINEMGARHSHKKVGDMGLDGYLQPNLYHGEAGIQVKQSDDIGRNVIDNFVSALQRAKYKKGYVIAFSFGKGAREEVARLKNEGKIDIKLVKVEDLLYKKKPID
ncbi:MAG TPA: DNA methyltransferase [bacterium]